MILRVISKLLLFLPLLGASLAPFSTQNIFLVSNGIGYAFKTSLLSRSFATKQIRVSELTPIFLSTVGIQSQKMQILHFLISR